VGGDPRLAEHHARVQAHYRALAGVYNARANQTCERRYHALVKEAMRGRARVLELGSGANALLDEVGSDGSVACDLSVDMLAQRRRIARTAAVVGAGETLPFTDGAFDGAYCINVLEHVADLAAVLAEAARVLSPGGLFFAVTPNGGWERWLDLAERMRMKIPEGPHQFLTRRILGDTLRRHFEIVEHRTFLLLPGGPPALSAVADRLTPDGLGWGFFQHVLARRL
jgi:SAM-dependent methyltransferase